MFRSSARDGGLRQRRILVAAAALTALLIAAGLYAALAHDPSPSATQPAPQPDTVDPLPAEEDESPAGGLPALPPTDDPEAFARMAASAVFEWDTAAAVPLSEYVARLVAVADPTGESAPGLVADLSTYLPTSAAWTDLRRYSTRQWLTITSSQVPTLWSQAKAEAGPNGLLPGTVAYTIEGARHRTGDWEGEPVATEHEVAFTVFAVCRPSYPRCYLLRLSRLDEPLS
ncbi:hypothetical protein [Nocardioides sp.]|uniref:Uncharacterized protein n=1 Tax=metagenome TaxID=256318 RepID=A0A2P2BX78_9ZZZZ